MTSPSKALLKGVMAQSGRQYFGKSVCVVEMCMVWTGEHRVRHAPGIYKPRRTHRWE